MRLVRRVRIFMLVAAAVLAMVVAACADDAAEVGTSGLAESSTDSTASAAATEGQTDPGGTSSTTEAAPAVDETTASTLTASGVAFASRVEPDGRAVDPGVEFPSNVNRIYPVFRADKLPRGLEIDVDSPDPDSYYAFLRPSAGASSVPMFGWRWIWNGQTVVEFEVDTTQPMFWLERYDRSAVGIFGGDPAETGLGPGEYLVEFTSLGETMFEEHFTIVDP